MATQTSNLGLTKPGYDEAADVVPAVNNNMDTLDAKIGAVPANTSVQAQINSNNQAIGNLAYLTTTEKGSLVGAANELNSSIVSGLATKANMIKDTLAGNASHEGIHYPCFIVGGRKASFVDAYVAFVDVVGDIQVINSSNIFTVTKESDGIKILNNAGVAASFIVIN